MENRDDDQADNNDANNDDKLCFYCSTLVEVKGNEYVRCSRCRTAKYCHRDCQQAHWKVHKKVCQKSDADDSNEVHNNIYQDSNNDDGIEKRKVCLYCYKEVDGNLRCKKCRVAKYCNRDCQVAHWKKHKKICKESNGDDRWVQLETMANDHCKQGNYRKAEKMYKELLDWQSSTLGDNDPDRFATMLSLGYLYFKRGKYKDAATLFNDKMIPLLGENHVYSLISVHGLGSVCTVIGDFNRAERFLKECLNRQTLVLGASHRDTLRTLNSIEHLIVAPGRLVLSNPLLDLR